MVEKFIFLFSIVLFQIATTIIHRMNNMEIFEPLLSNQFRMLVFFSYHTLKVECKSHPRTNSRVPWGAVKLCFFQKISCARMVKILVRYWLRIRSMCVYV